MELRRNVLMRLKPENDLSASQLDTGSVHPIVKSVEIFGYTSLSASLRQLAIFSGKHIFLDFSYCSQNLFQSFNSDSSDDGDGMSISLNCNLLARSLK